LFKPLTNDDYNYIAINEILMYISNNGDGSHDPVTDGNGFYWPGGKLATKAAIFEDGLVWGGKINGEIRVNGNTHRQGLQAGKILTGGVADNPDDPKYRIYKIRKDWESLQQGSERDAYERDFLEWPVEDGAPWVDVNGDGLYSPGFDSPEFIGDEMLWYVANDMDTSRSRFTYGSDPIGLEIQCLVWGYNKTNFLGDVVFKKYTLINKSTTTIDSMYLGLWTDDDLGDACDDFVGCDTLLNLGYSYNGDNDDGGGTGSTYGTPPPAVGHQFVQGPTVLGEPTDSARFNNQWVSGYKNLPITAFMLYIGASARYSDPQQGVYEGTLEVYNNLRGLIWNGNPVIDPHTDLITRFVVAGDPVAGEGWYEGDGWPGGEDPCDRRYLMSSGPFTMAPGDTQEVVIAILIAMGDDYLDSISELKMKSQSVQIAYDLDFNTVPVMDKPNIKVVPHDQSLTLYWEPNAEDYDRVDPILKNRVLGDSTYTFEGYRLWQFRDLAGNEPKLLRTFDLENNVVIIYESKIINGYPAEVVVIIGPNEGVRRSYTITKNIYDEQPLNNANPYYFAVTAYAFSENSDPSYVESKPEIIEVIPGLQQIDETFPYDSGEKIIADHITGNGDGNVELFVIDPNALTGDEYRVVFEGDGKENAYSFINYTTNDSIIADCTDFAIDTVGAQIIDGFILKIENTGLGQIYPYRDYGIKAVVELKGPGGAELEAPVDVFESANSTGEWEINSYYYRPREDFKQEINIHDAAGYNDYEIRFTPSGSEYYPTGSGFGWIPWTLSNSKAVDRVPFEIWDIGRNDSVADDVRLTIKTLDDYRNLIYDSTRVDQDGKWSQLENGDWEPIFVYFADSTYSEPLPENSGQIDDASRFKIGKIIISGELPAEGTVIRITTWKPLSAEDVFSVVATAPNTKNYAAAKTNLDDISVFPNPFLGTAIFSGYSEQSFVRFTNLPAQVTVRIFSLAGVYVRHLEKNDENPWLDWNLKNNAGEQVSSGVYIAHLEMPNIGEKVMKLAVILERQN
jgi:hypothetical protein